MLKKIYGVNIAVKDLEAAVATYRRILGVEPRYMGEGDFAFPNLVGATFFLGDTAINLIASKTDDTAVAKFVASRGEGVFLVSLESDDAEGDSQVLAERGASVILKQAAAGNFGKVNFVHPKSMHGVQFEIYELPK